MRQSYESLSEEKKKADLNKVLESFTNVKEIDYSKAKTSSCPIQTVNFLQQFLDDIKVCHKKAIEDEIEWEEYTSNFVGTEPTCSANDDNLNVSNTKHHLRQKRDKGNMMAAINSITPVIKKSSAALSVQAHIMTISISIQYTKFLKPSQGSAISCSDQPFYAKKKKIQWGYPHQFPRYAIFVLMGGLHIEHQFLKINGQLVSGTGLGDIWVLHSCRILVYRRHFVTPMTSRKLDIQLRLW